MSAATTEPVRGCQQPQLSQSVAVSNHNWARLIHFWSASTLIRWPAQSLINYDQLPQCSTYLHVSDQLICIRICLVSRNIVLCTSRHIQTIVLHLSVDNFESYQQIVSDNVSVHSFLQPLCLGIFLTQLIDWGLKNRKIFRICFIKKSSCFTKYHLIGNNIITLGSKGKMDIFTCLMSLWGLMHLKQCPILFHIFICGRIYEIS